jgi:hypothetical protein
MARDSITEIQKGISFGMASGAIIEITKRDIEPDALSKQQTSAVPWAIWGKDNNYPQRVIDENMQDTTSASALDFKTKAHYGKGLYIYQESVTPDGVEKKTPRLLKDCPADMQEFFWRNNIASFQLGLVQDYEWWNFLYVQYIINASCTKILGVKWQRTKDVRSGKRNVVSGEVPSYYLSALWPKPMESHYIELPAFIPWNELSETVPNGLYKHQLPSIDKDYYPTAKWQSNHRWLSVSRKISQWINANIDNSVNIKYHVEIPEQYFIDLYPEKNYESQTACTAARVQAEKSLKEEIDKCLAGAENAQKIFYTKFAVDANGEPRPGWKINVLPNEIKDAAWLSADATAASRILSAHGVDPTLSGLRTGNSLQVGSGSDMREKFNFYLQLHTTIGRQVTTEWFDFVSRVNGWPPDIKIGFRDVYLDTLNNAKTGVQVQNEPSPTSAAA